jgi:CHAT domain-containing protein/tetratricopeptide (TPR) repeat protein
MNKSCDSKAIVLIGIVTLAWSVMGACRSQPVPAGQDAIRIAFETGRFAEAERLAGAWLARVEATDGPDSLPVAQAIGWLVRAKLKNGKAAEPETVAMAERAVRLNERHVGRQSIDTAASIYNLANVHSQRGQFAAALRLHGDALAIRKAALAADHPAVADSLDEYGFALIQLERFHEAEQALADARRSRERRSDDSPIALARTLELIGLLHRSSGNFAAAVSPLDRALAIRREVLPDHPDTVITLQIRGDVDLLMGDTLGAQRIWSSALQLAESTLRPDHPLVADLLRKLGFAEHSLGNLGQARQLRERALRIGERSLAPCDPLAVTLVNSVAASLHLDGDYLEARRRYEQARATTEKCVGTTTAAYATILSNEGDLAAMMGDLQEADRLHSRAIDIWSRGLGPDHPFVARGLDALAEDAASQGQRARARDLYERALLSRERSLGNDHPHVAWTLTNLAKLLAESGEQDKALSCLNRAIAIYEKSGPSDEPDHFARALELRGMIDARRGNLESARASLSQGLSARQRIFGDNHPLVAEVRATLAAVDLARGDSQQALTGALGAEGAGRDHLLFTVRYLPERQAMAYAAKRPRGLDLALTIAADGMVSDPAVVLDAVIRSRGVVLDELAARLRFKASADSSLQSLAVAVTTSRQRYANLVIRSLQEPVSRSLLDDARRQKEEAERALAERSVETRTELIRAAAGIEEVRTTLPSDAALVAFVAYERTRRFQRGHAARAFLTDASYAALVITSGSKQTVFVTLDTADRIDPLVRRWQREASGDSLAAGVAAARSDHAYNDAAVLLRRALWDRLAPHMNGARRVFVVPDGLISLVNLAALPDEKGTFVLEKGPVINHLTTERDLLSTGPASGAQALLAVGGPAFDETSSTAMGPIRRSIPCPSFAKVRFENLPGSKSEVDEIRALWPRPNGNEVVLLQGAAATESAVKQAMTGRRIVHLATHGFFLGKDCSPGLVNSRAVGGITTASAASNADNPLLLAGLAFAGANHRNAAALDQDDGLLTAEEIAGLNLQGTEWAVLSACDTGLGEIKAGEGVFGLRRAFQIAGARTVIMSLWSVEDDSTREWMRALYQGRLQQRLDTAAAVREAGLTVLRARRAKGQSTHPFYWAAFVAAGDWR